MGLPMLNVLAVSLSTQTNSENPGLVLFPSPATLEGYRFIWSYINLWRPFVNTAYVSVVGTILHVILSAVGGYVLMQRDLPLRKILTTFVILTMTIPGRAHPGLDLPGQPGLRARQPLRGPDPERRGLGVQHPPDAQLLHGHPAVAGRGRAHGRQLGARPPSAASTSGSRCRRPMTVATLQFISRWNNIALVATLISDMKKMTLPVILRGLLVEVQSTSGTAFIYANAKMAAVVISALPLVRAVFLGAALLRRGRPAGGDEGMSARGRSRSGSPLRVAKLQHSEEVTV